jgi:hypothetical protein
MEQRKEMKKTMKLSRRIIRCSEKMAIRERWLDGWLCFKPGEAFYNSYRVGRRLTLGCMPLCFRSVYNAISNFISANADNSG